MILDSSAFSSEGQLVSQYLFFGLFWSFCNLSPHMIIFRVTTGRSFTKLPSAKDGLTSNPIQFAQTAESSLLQSSSFNRELGMNPELDVERLEADTTSDGTQISTTAHTAQEATQITEGKLDESNVEKK
ncbi:hypothetical protein H1R20_g11543, partial [Candolleomyces eurysporus]